MAYLATFKNPVLNKLADECGLIIDPFNYHATLAEIEFFAEQLVMLCARIESQENNPDHDETCFNYSILNHFGIIDQKLPKD